MDSKASVKIRIDASSYDIKLTMKIRWSKQGPAIDKMNFFQVGISTLLTNKWDGIKKYSLIRRVYFFSESVSTSY